MPERAPLTIPESTQPRPKGPHPRSVRGALLKQVGKTKTISFHYWKWFFPPGGPFRPCITPRRRALAAPALTSHVPAVKRARLSRLSKRAEQAVSTARGCRHEGLELNQSTELRVTCYCLPLRTEYSHWPLEKRAEWYRASAARPESRVAGVTLFDLVTPPPSDGADRRPWWPYSALGVT